MKVLQILYGGLGGHGSVFFSMVEADTNHVLRNEALFIAIEDLKSEYAERCKENGVPYSFIKKRPGKHVRFLFRLFKTIRKSDADAVIVHGNIWVIPVWLALKTKRRRVKLITVMHQAVLLLSRQDKIGLKMSLKLSDTTVFLTEEYKAAVEKMFPLKPGAGTAVIANGIDLSFYHPAPHNHQNDEIVLGMQSRIMATKDHATLLDAVALLKKTAPYRKFRLRIAGDGENKTAMEEKAISLGIADDVEFTGLLSEELLPAFINSLDIYIHATLGETMSTAIMQVMACRKPVIASDVKGVDNMIINKKTGLLVPVLNADKMAESILYLADNPGRAAELANNAYAFAAEHYDNGLMFRKYLSLLLPADKTDS